MGMIGRPKGSGTKTPIQRFSSKVHIAKDGCWLWTGATNPRGYALLNVGGRSTLAHRYAYETFGGSIPNGWTIDHACEVKACVRPDHLEPAPASVNHARADRSTFGRGQTKKTHCRNGHPFNAENTYRYHNERRCRICGRDAQRRYTGKRG